MKRVLKYLLVAVVVALLAVAVLVFFAPDVATGIHPEG